VDIFPKLTSRDLESMPDNGKLYELIEGELYVSRQPSWDHQYTCVQIASALNAWSKQTGLGSTNAAPGLIFAEDDDVAPDVVWISHRNLATALGADRKLHAAPELIVEVLSPGSANQHRDRQTKLKLYSRRGVREYWVVDCERRQFEIYRRQQGALALDATLLEQDTLTSPLLPGFSCPVADLFFRVPPAPERTNGDPT
jgi:Uma2 family endonuclease